MDLTAYSNGAFPPSVVSRYSCFQAASPLLSFPACHAIHTSIFASVPWALCCSYQYNQFIRHCSVHPSKTCAVFPKSDLQPYRTTFFLSFGYF